MNCPTCNRFCLNDDCLEAHIAHYHTYKRDQGEGGFKKGDAKPDSDWKCQDCKQCMPKARHTRGWHKCGEEYCGNCKRYSEKGVVHRCSVPLRIGTAADGGPENGVWAFDFETKPSDDGGFHTVNYSCARHLGTGEIVEHWNIEEFCAWFMKLKKCSTSGSTNTSNCGHNISTDTGTSASTSTSTSTSISASASIKSTEKEGAKEGGGGKTAGNRTGDSDSRSKREEGA